MVLPLNIFEPRYKLMIGECLRENKPFGVVLIKEGTEVGGPATTYEFGTSAYVTQVEKLEDDRMNIQTVGYQRFRIHEVRTDRPYLVGLVEDSPFAGDDDPELSQIAAEIAPRLKAYLETLKKAGALNLTFDKIPEDGRTLAFLIAILLPISTQEKQALLESETLAALLGRQLALLKREIVLLNHMLVYNDQRGSGPPQFSKN
jgi:Lon protease-like protein